MLLFERFTDGTIEIFFRDGKKKELIPLSSEICQKSTCSINELKTALSSVLPADWDLECENGDNLNSYKIAFVTVFSIFVCFVCASFLFKLCSPKSTRRYTRVPNPTKYEG